jgi:hypothetical protein
VLFQKERLQLWLSLWLSQADSLDFCMVVCVGMLVRASQFEPWPIVALLCVSVVGPVGFEPMKLWIQQDGKGLRWESELLEGIVSSGPRSDQHIYREIMICDKWLI